MAKLSTYATATPVLTDYASGIDDPGGTPSVKNFTFQSVMDLFEGNIELATQRVDLDFQSSFDINNVVNVDVEGFIDYAENATPGTPAANTVRLYAADDNGFSSINHKAPDGVTFQVSRDEIHVGRNTTGSTISKGQWVYISGSSGTVPTIALADASTDATANTLGLVISDIENNSNGRVLQGGDLGSLDTSAFNDGDTLYLSTTPGVATTTRPTGTNVVVVLGTVIKGGTAGAGIIAVNIQIIAEPDLTLTYTNKTIDLADNTLTGTLAQFNTALSDGTFLTSASSIGALTDVDLTGSPSPADGDVLTFDGTNWVAEAAAGGSPAGSSGQLQYNNSGSFGAVNLWREGANTVAQRNGTNAQTLHVYNTFTDASNYERASLFWTFDVLTLKTEAAGTGAARNFDLFIGSARILRIDANTVRLYKKLSFWGSGSDRNVGENGTRQANDVFLVGGLHTQDAGELTISSGAVTATGSYHTIDTEGDASSDDLDTINGGVDGNWLVIQAESGARTVVAKDGTGNLQLNGDFSLDNAQDTLTLIYSGALSAWCEISRSDNGA